MPKELKRRRNCAAGRRPLKLPDFTTVDFGFRVGRYVLRYTQARQERALPKVYRPHLKRYKWYSRQQLDHESFGENNLPCPPHRLVTIHHIVKETGSGSLKRSMSACAVEEALDGPAHDPYSVDAVQDAVIDLQAHITPGQYSAAIKKAELSEVWRRAFIKTPKIVWKLRMLFDLESKLH